ncbi:MAG TPA: carbohydrate ABC transporter permease [Thermomicrobiales bacterium]|nr:carbohydrate ABC transporter permease [Thermomicrobiales bacterium]
MAMTNPDAATRTSTGLTADTTIASAMKRRKRNTDRPVWMEEPPLAIKFLKAFALAWIVIIMMFPLVYVIAVSFSSAEDVLAGGLVLFPANPTLDAYRAIFEGGVVNRALRVSVGLTIFGTLAQMVVTTMLAYGLSKPGVPGSRIALFIVLGAFLFSPGMIPSYLLVKELGMLDTFPALIVPQLVNAFNLVVLRNFFMNIPQELLDAARVDGANDVQIFFKITLPLSKAALAVISLFYGVAIWNAFFNAVLYIYDTSKWPIQLVLRQYVLQGSSLAQAAEFNPNQPPPPPQTIQMAIVVVATIPILLVYPFLQKYFTKGVLTGAIKG